MSEAEYDSRPIALEKGAVPVPGYQLVNCLGSGGFGSVWKARSPGEFHVALKFVRLEEESLASIELRSLKLIKNLRHPNLLTPFGSWTIGGFLIIGMDLADGSLQKRLKEAKNQGHQGIPHEELLEYMAESAKGLDYLNSHRHDLGDGKLVGIQHRDIKPDNILLCGGGVKVADFGLSRLLKTGETSHTGYKTLAYAAPEFFRGQTSDFSDQYSLAIAYCVLRSGVFPFPGSDFEMLDGHLHRAPNLAMLPDSERVIVSKALAKEPEGRWSHCRAFVDQLRQLGPQPKLLYTSNGIEISPPTTVGNDSQPSFESLPKTIPTQKSSKPSTSTQSRTPRRSRPLRMAMLLILGLMAMMGLMEYGTGGFLIQILRPNDGVRDRQIDGTAEIHFNEGVKAFTAGQPERAIEYYNRSILLDPKFAQAYEGRGLVFKAQGKSELAIADFSRAIEFDPNHGSAYNNRGNTYQAQGAVDQAILDYGHAIRVNPSNAFAFNNRGNSYMGRGQVDQAIADFTAAIEIDPRYASARNGRGSAFLAKGENERAIDDYSEAIRLHPKNAQYYRNRAIAYTKVGRTSKARADEKMAEKLTGSTR